ncbi:MAG: SIS domain-containing protein [Elusimicrobiota bacterium]
MAKKGTSGRPIGRGSDWADRAFGRGPTGLSAEAFARWYREEVAAQWEAVDLKAVAHVAGWLRAARGTKRQVFVAGNGGSAAIASHMATDLAKTAATGSGPLLRCVALTDNVSYMTAIANDIGYDAVFSRQMENLLNKGDIVILISGSGNSPSVLEAARYARRKGARTAALLGFDGGKLKSLVDVPLLVGCGQYGVVEEIHMGIGHVLGFYLRQA